MENSWNGREEEGTLAHRGSEAEGRLYPLPAPPMPHLWVLHGRSIHLWLHMRSPGKLLKNMDSLNNWDKVCAAGPSFGGFRAPLGVLLCNYGWEPLGLWGCSHCQGLGAQPVRGQSGLCSLIYRPQLLKWTFPKGSLLNIQFLFYQMHFSHEIALPAKSLQLCLTLCDPLDCGPPGFSILGDSLGKNPAVGCHALLKGIVPSRGLNLCLLGLLHWQASLENSLPLVPPGKITLETSAFDLLASLDRYLSHFPAGLWRACH